MESRAIPICSFKKSRSVFTSKAFFKDLQGTQHKLSFESVCELADNGSITKRINAIRFFIIFIFIFFSFMF